MKKSKNLRTVIIQVFKKNPFEFIITFIVIILSAAAVLLPPLVLEKAVNELADGTAVSIAEAVEYLGLIAVSGLLEAARNVMITVIGQKITHGLRSQLCGKLKRLPAEYFSRSETGKTASLFVNDVDAVDALFTSGIVSMFADVCKLVGIMSIIFTKTLGLGIVLVIVLPLLFALTRSFRKKMLRAQTENRAAIGKVNNHIPETIKNIRMIQTLRREKYMEQRYNNYINESYRATDKSNVFDSIYSPIIILSSAAITALMMICTAYSDGAGAFFGISVGTAVAVIAYVGQVFSPLESLGMEIQNIQSAVAGVNRINEFLAENERKMPCKEVIEVRKNQPVISFEKVCFGYGEKEVLNNFSFKAEKGDFVTFVGRTGAGKSTIFKLLLGLYEPGQGKVLVCGIEAADISDEKKRRLFGYVAQQPQLVSGSIAQQISLFDNSLTGEKIVSAARLVGLDEVIEKMPQGYETPINKAAFSQGQLLLLSIARAICSEPEILLLDEITANLDSSTEINILEAISKAAQGRTVLSITHRLAGTVTGKILRVE